MSESQPQKLLVANRGEIAVRILKTAKRLRLKTIAIYSPSDSLSPHVTLADEAVPLSSSCPESTAYLDIPTILSICKEHTVTLLHPGYGFLSENYDFASQVRDCGLTWIGPQPGIVRMMGLKHEAREMARKAGVPLNPGSDGLVSNEEAVEVAKTIGYPVMLKATAGGGGLGMVVCNNVEDLKERLVSTRARCKVSFYRNRSFCLFQFLLQTLFGNDGLFIERYFASARHIEVQVCLLSVHPLELIRVLGLWQR
jgi:urea carboxylase